MSANQAVPKAYVDQQIASIPASGVSEAFVNNAISGERVATIAREAQVLADAHTDMITFVNEEQAERTAADDDIRSYVSGAISTIISGGTATLQALDTINNIYAAITGDASGVVSGLLFTKANLAAPNTFTAANTFASGLKISGATQQYLYFGTNWRVGGVGSELKFEHSPLGTFTSGDSAEIVF